MLFMFENITYTLGSDERRITVSGSLNNGETLIVQGTSGAGKSTFMRVLSRLQSAEDGECFLNNTSWSAYTATTWRKNVHYLFQKPVIFDGSVLDNLHKPFELKLFSGEKNNFDLTKAKNLIKKLLLREDILYQDAKTLSGGEAARVAFIRALLLNPSVLLLDEPTAALDEASKQVFYQVLSDWLKEPQHGALLISHNYDYKELKNYFILKIAG